MQKSIVSQFLQHESRSETIKPLGQSMLWPFVVIASILSIWSPFIGPYGIDGAPEIALAIAIAIFIFYLHPVCSALIIWASAAWAIMNAEFELELLTGQVGLSGGVSFTLLASGFVLGVSMRWMKAKQFWLSKTQQSLQALHRLAEALVRSNRDCVKLLDPQGRLKLVNYAGLKLLEAKTISELEQYDWFSGLTEEERSKLQAAWNKAVIGGYGEYVGRLATVGHELKHWYVVLTPVRNASNDIKYMLVVSRDITDSVEHHQAIATHNNDLKALFDSFHNPFLGLDNDNTIVYCNSLVEEFSGRHLDELNGKPVNQVLPDFMTEPLTNLIEQAKSSRQTVSIKLQVNDTQKWFKLEVTPKAQGCNVFIEDISDAMLQQLSMQQALLNAELAQEMESFASWEYDLTNQRLNLSRQALKLLNLSDKESKSHFSMINRLIDEEDRLKFTKAFLEVSQDNKKVTLNSDLVNQNGQLVSVKIALQGLKDDSDRVVKIIGSIQDITEQKAREAYLQEAECFVRGVIDALPRQICVIKADGTIVSVNKAWMEVAERATQNEKSNGRGENYLLTCQRASENGCVDAASVYDGILSIVRNQQDRFECEYQMTINNMVHWFRMYVNPMMHADGTLDRNLLVISHEDFTQQKQLLTSFVNQQVRLDLANSATNDGIWDWLINTNETFYSDRFLRLVNCQRDTLPPFDTWFENNVDQTQRESLVQMLNFKLKSGDTFDVQCQLKVGENESGPIYRWFHLRGKAQLVNGQAVRFAGSLMDIEENRRLLNMVELREQRFQEMVRSIPDVFVDFDLSTNQFIYVSPAFEKVWQRSVGDATNASLGWWIETIVEDDREFVLNFYRNAIEKAKADYVEYRITTKDSISWVGSRVFPVTDDAGNVIRLVGSARDITDTKGIEEKLRHSTKLDSLMKIPNRTVYIEALSKVIGNREPASVQFVNAKIDIDRFTQINKAVGYQQADLILQQLAHRLQNVVDGRALLCRTGGDEFSIMADPDQIECDVEAFLAQLMSAFKQPFLIDETPIFVTASIGAVFSSSKNAESLENVTRAIESAVKWVKQSGGNCYRIIHSESLQENQQSLHLESELRQALENKEFQLYYQAKVDAQSGKVAGCEALLRWHSNKHGIMSPADFIPVLEESGLIVEVGDQVILQAIKQLELWAEQGYQDISIAVNISSRQLSNLHFYDRLESMLNASNIRPSQLEFELTETSLMSDPQLAAELIGRFKSLGIKIAIDDFGTGYSSLSYLKRFQPDTLKIDKSFIDEIEGDKHSLNIVEGIIDLSHRLGISVVAEGVEQESQWKLLQTAQCDALQGYYFAKPLPLSAFEQEIMPLFHTSPPVVVNLK